MKKISIVSKETDCCIVRWWILVNRSDREKQIMLLVDIRSEMRARSQTNQSKEWTKRARKQREKSISEASFSKKHYRDIFSQKNG